MREPPRHALASWRHALMHSLLGTGSSHAAAHLACACNWTTCTLHRSCNPIYRGCAARMRGPPQPRRGSPYINRLHTRDAMSHLHGVV